MNPLVLEIEVPIACFRQSRAREYAETYPVPPPSTIYGMLLSIVGETDRYRHIGTRLAVGLHSEPAKSTVIRTFRRLKRKDLHDPSNARPDYQELLTDIRFTVWVTDGEGPPTLRERLRDAFAQPASIDRFGGLSLGESRDLVNAVSVVSADLLRRPLRWLVRDEDGLLPLPIWVDHVGSKGTRWRRYQLEETPSSASPPDPAWTIISPD